MMERIAFRVDGGLGIGLGHIMRCLALARAFPDNCDVLFITRSVDHIVGLLKGSGFAVERLCPSGTVDLKEFDDVMAFLSRNRVDTVVTDSYLIEQEYLALLKEHVSRLITIHDFAPFPFPSLLSSSSSCFSGVIALHRVFRFSASSLLFSFRLIALSSTRFTQCFAEDYGAPTFITDSCFCAIQVFVCHLFNLSASLLNGWCVSKPFVLLASSVLMSRRSSFISS